MIERPTTDRLICRRLLSDTADQDQAFCTGDGCSTFSSGFSNMTHWLDFLRDLHHSYGLVLPVIMTVGTLWLIHLNFLNQNDFLVNFLNRIFLVSFENHWLL